MMNAWDAGLAEPLLEFLKNPADLVSIQSIYKKYSQDSAAQAAVARILLDDPDFKALYESWYEPEPFTLEQLATLPDESFGRAYAEFMVKNKLTLHFIDRFPERNVLSYLWLRANHVHDITHLILGYDTSYLGELAVKGFELAQYQSPATATILGGGFLSVGTMAPTTIGAAFEKILEGYCRGKQYPLLAGVRWDKEWSTPLVQLKQKLGSALPRRPRHSSKV